MTRRRIGTSLEPKGGHRLPGKNAVGLAVRPSMLLRKIVRPPRCQQNGFWDCAGAVFQSGGGQLVKHRALSFFRGIRCEVKG
jgi:hypothetical protein